MNIEILLNWTSRYISGYTNERQLSDYAISLVIQIKSSSFLIHDLSITRPINLKDGTIDLKFGIINLTNEPAPKLFDAPDFSFDTRLHDPTGRTFTFLFSISCSFFNNWLTVAALLISRAVPKIQTDKTTSTNN